MDSERDSLFSPASNAIVARLLPTMFLEMREDSDCVMVSIDVKDAFLTVKRQTATVVNCTLADGEVQPYGLGRVLPGQRDGSLLWHRDITSVLHEKLGMTAHVPCPCILKSADNSCYALIHVDDILVVGKRDFVMNRLVKCLKGKYEVSVQTMEKPGDEIQFLKRKMVLHHDGRLSIQTHYKHVQQMCALLGLNKRLQSKKTPGHSDMDLQDLTGELSPDLAKKFRTCVGILLYLASDLPHAQHVVRHLATYSTVPTQKSLVVLKHLVSYLACHEDVCISLKWRGRNAGVFHQYATEPGETVLEVFTDSDWASDKTSRRSVSCATMFVGGCLLFSSSRTQKLVSLSSAEAEVYSCSSGASDAIMLSRLLAWMTGFKVTIHLHTDSSGARGILQRHGVGRVRHLSCRILWLQQLISDGVIRLGVVAGTTNPADIGTKRLPNGRLRSLMFLLGMYNVSSGTLEGADDPGNVFRKKQHLMSLISVLGLMNLKGCDADESENPSYGLLAFTVVFGLCCTLLWMMLGSGNQNQLAQNEPDAEPLVDEGDDMDVDAGTAPPASEAVTAPSLPASSTEMPSSARPTDPLLTAENYVAWLLERCCRRRDQAVDHGRRRLYEERVTILLGLRAALGSPHEIFRASARRSLGTMSDISDDESSPNFSRINGPASLGEAQRALQFINALQHGSSSSTGFGTNVDMVANALGRNMNFPEQSPSSGSGEGETRSQAMERYMSSRRSNVSDPDLWNYLHYGDELSSETENDET